MQRRTFIGMLAATFASLQLLPHTLFAGISNTTSNFKQIYSNFRLKNEFFNFLKNVFNLVPEEDLHKLIAETVLDETEG
jgi:hypothetical protein